MDLLYKLTLQIRWGLSCNYIAERKGLNFGKCG